MKPKGREFWNSVLSILFFLFFPGASHGIELSEVIAKLEELDYMRKNLASALIDMEEPVTAATFREVCAPVGKSMKEWAAQEKISARQVSERNRNPLNSPDETELNILSHFRDNPERLYVVNQLDGLKIYRRISITAGCTKCHGAKDERPLFIREGYPGDKAFGFKEGELRGIYSVSIE
jgi:hypothetical protein